jgi:DNA-binding CsgD family transcriptional regulator
VELLEREGALAALASARKAAAAGSGRVVFVTGEPGIGKTALVTQFVAGLEPGARVLLGTCDDLSIPRPLGPLHDIAGSASPALGEALAAGTASHEVHDVVIAELERLPHPVVVVLEDVHWADDATLDLVTVLGRRIGSLPALLVLTFRGGEAASSHALRGAIGAIRADESVFLELEPLSEAAVATLAGRDAGSVYAATRGNPFFVAELLASRTADALPPSVANAVLGRAARLGEDERRLVELVSVVPNRVAASVLDTVLPGWTAAAEEPERRQLLEIEPRHVRFRHELARNAVRASLPLAVRRGLHAEMLQALLASDADPADIVHHAEAAGAQDVVGEYALVAARRAAALESNREAYSHYRRAADFADRLDPAEQAQLHEDLASAAYVVGQIESALPAIERAIAIHRARGDTAALGRCTRVLSRLCWFAGDGPSARANALEAIAVLEPLGESAELARAYSGMSQLAMLAEDAGQATVWAERALELAGRLGDERTRAHALVNLGSARIQVDTAESSILREAHAMADAAGDREEATRALVNLAYTFICWARPHEAAGYAAQALDYAEAHELDQYASYLKTTLAWLALRRGEWDEAERVTRREIERGITVVQLLAKTVLAELAVRRGDADAVERLADLAAQADRTAELQRVAPVLELMAERALTGDGEMPVTRLAALLGDGGQGGGPAGGRFGLRLAAWAAVANVDVAVELGSPVGPYAAMLERDWTAAADAFGEIGWPYDRALLLSLLDDEELLLEALAIARGLGAEPLTRRLTGRLRGLGAQIPQGPRAATRANPAGLTARQLEVLSLLVAGLTNAEIADRLVVSPRTAEHHVSAVLTKLGASSRHDAAQRASELGLVVGS